MHPHYNKLAEGLVGLSVAVQPGERVLIDLYDAPREIGIALMEAVRKLGGMPYVQVQDTQLHRAFLEGGCMATFEASAQWELMRMQKMDAYIAIRGSHNIFEQSGVEAQKVKSWMAAMKPVLDWRVNQTKWVVLRWPTPSMAQLAMMSTADFEDFYFRVCTLDYSKMKPGMAALKKRMEATHQVHIMGPGTDLKFSIQDIPAITCGGQFNIPDGEVFTAPVKTSVEGYIAYNTPSVYEGIAFDNIKFVFKAGQIVEATCNQTDRLNQILDRDAGARYIGEFAIGFNPYIQLPMRDILFDEKIAGSFHFTPGQAYEGADNGNRSHIHWDLVSIQRPEYGGGEIYFDGQLIRKDGLFVTPDLQALNPDQLV